MNITETKDSGLPGVPYTQNSRLEAEEILDLILYLNTEWIQAPM